MDRNLWVNAAKTFQDMIRICFGLSWLVVAFSPAIAQAPTRPILVFGAASVTNVLDELAASYSKREGVEIKTSYAASSVLAKQLEAGAPADIFISADQEWMDYAAKKAVIKPDSRFNLVANTLVLIAGVNNGAMIDLKPGLDLRIALAGQKLSMADPNSVPAGRYGKAALIALGGWDFIASSVAPADNVRTALAYVARGETPLGIVYGTDAKSEAKVRVVATFPAHTHPPIIYPAALTIQALPAAEKFLAYLQTQEAQAAFLKAGFSKPN
jgi:molybdate transport system substrate-binding protein